MIRRIVALIAGDMHKTIAFHFLFVCAAVVFAISTMIALASAAWAQDVPSIELVAIDAVTEGNEAAMLGPLDGCVEAEAGSEFAVDLIVDEIPSEEQIIGFQMDVNYDQELLQVTGYEHEFLLAAEGMYEPVEGLTDPVPDSDGVFTIAVLDTASNVETDENMESGPGVVARITFEALAEGTSTIAVGFDAPDIYPALISDQNEAIQVNSIGSATAAIGSECPADAEPEIMELPPLEDLLPTPAPAVDPADLPEPEGGGIDYALLAGSLAIVAVGAVGIAGGVAYYQRKSRR